MKRITLISSIFVALFGANISAKADAPVNLLDQYYYGAESAVQTVVADRGYFFSTPVSYFLTNEKAKTGSYSVKFYTADVTGITADNQGFCGSGAANPAGSKVTLAIGTYDVQITVWVSDDSPKSLMTAFGDGLGGWLQTDFDLTAVAKNQWVTLTKTASLTKAITAGKLTLKVKKADLPTAGTSTLYYDDLSIFASTVSALKTVSELDCKVIANVNANVLRVESVIGSEVIVMNVAGKMIETAKLQGNSLELSTSNYSKGIYFVEVSSEGKKTVKKVAIL